MYKESFFLDLMGTLQTEAGIMGLLLYKSIWDDVAKVIGVATEEPLPEEADDEERVEYAPGMVLYGSSGQDGACFVTGNSNEETGWTRMETAARGLLGKNGLDSTDVNLVILTSPPWGILTDKSAAGYTATVDDRSDEALSEHQITGFFIRARQLVDNMGGTGIIALHLPTQQMEAYGERAAQEGFTVVGSNGHPWNVVNTAYPKYHPVRNQRQPINTEQYFLVVVRGDSYSFPYLQAKDNGKKKWAKLWQQTSVAKFPIRVPTIERITKAMLDEELSHARNLRKDLNQYFRPQQVSLMFVFIIFYIALLKSNNDEDLYRLLHWLLLQF